VTDEASPPPPPRPRRRTPWWRWAVAAVLLGVLVAFVSPAQVAAAVAEADAGWLLAAVVVSLMAHAVQAGRLALLTRSVGLPWGLRDVVSIHFAALAYTLVIPGGNVAGAAVRIVKLCRGQPPGAAARAGAALLCDRLAATATLGLTGVVGVAMVRPDGTPLWLAAMLGLTLATAALLVPAVVGVGRLTRASGVARLPVVGRTLAKLSAVEPLRPGALLAATGLSLVAHALGIATCALIARALALPLDPGEVAFARAAMLVAALLPVTVAGLGLREGAALLALAGLHHGPREALAWSLLVFAAIWVVPALLGAAAEAARWLRPRRPGPA
jgi:glycosyltransferase 2 family protein